MLELQSQGPAWSSRHTVKVRNSMTPGVPPGRDGTWGMRHTPDVNTGSCRGERKELKPTRLAPWGLTKEPAHITKPLATSA